MFRKILLAVLLICSVAMPAQAFLAEPINVGNWSGGAYYDDNTRQFSHCAVAAEYQNGMTLLLAWAADGLRLGFMDERRWGTLPVGSQQNVRVQIDDRWDSSGPANVAGSGQLVTTMGREPRPVTAVRRGLQLSATIGKETVSFELTATNAAVDALAACYRDHS
jgi:hypothetical protein